MEKTRVEANCKKGVHVTVKKKKNKCDALHLHPFMTILTSSVKKDEKNKCETYDLDLERPPPKTACGAKAPFLIQLWSAWVGGAAFGDRSPIFCSPREKGRVERGTERKR